MMNKTHGRVIAVMILALAIAPASQVFAFGGGYRSGQDTLATKFFYKAHFLLEESQSLGLSEEQVRLIRELKMDVKKQSIRQNAEIDILRLEIKSKLYEPKIDSSAVQKLIDQKYEIKKALAKSFVNAYAKLKSIVSEKQWEEMVKLKETRPKDCPWKQGKPS